METPKVQFATTRDNVRIAYTAWGSGPTLVIVPPILSNVELTWESEIYRRVFERLGQHLRVIAFDKRGIGMSDRFDEAPTTEQRIADFEAVMDAEKVEKAHISGISEGGVMAQVFAADFPQRTDRLAIANTFAPKRHRQRILELWEGERDRAESGRRWARVVELWGIPSPEGLAGWAIPSRANDEDFLEWSARLERQSATRAGFAKQLDSTSALDAGSRPERIEASTLIIHTVDDQLANIGHARVLKELIPDSGLVEFPGGDHFFWASPDWRDMLDTQLRFLIDGPLVTAAERRFATVLFTDLVGSTATSVHIGDERWRETIEAHDRAATQVVQSHRGLIVKTTGDGVVATFDSPSLGVEAARALRNELQRAGLTIRAGIHAGEIEVRENDDIAGYAVNLAARVEQVAPDGEIYATSTVRDLLLGGSLEFESAGTHSLKGFEGSWELCRLL